jgi:hypothetical protein
MLIIANYHLIIGKEAYFWEQSAKKSFPGQQEKR